MGATLNPATLARWRTELSTQSLSPNSINRMLSSVRAVMKSAAEQGYIPSDVAQQFDSVRGVKVAAMKDKLKDHARTKIKPADMRRLCEAPDPNKLVGKLYRALLLTIASSGARISEVVTLKLPQIEQRTQGKGGVCDPGQWENGRRHQGSAPIHLTGYDPRPMADSRTALGGYTDFARLFAAHCPRTSSKSEVTF